MRLLYDCKLAWVFRDITSGYWFAVIELRYHLFSANHGLDGLTLL